MDGVFCRGFLPSFPTTGLTSHEQLRIQNVDIDGRHPDGDSPGEPVDVSSRRAVSAVGHDGKAAQGLSAARLKRMHAYIDSAPRTAPSAFHSQIVTV